MGCHFGLNFLMFILSFGEFFYFLSHYGNNIACEWHFETCGKKSRLFRRFCQYSVIILSYTEKNATKLAVNFTDLVKQMSQESEKLKTLDFGFTRHTSSQLVPSPKSLESLLTEARKGATT